ncbi:MAG TPA: hypothetical protein VGP08_09440 [Pyrinomonadaceae bacterium]|nr:hypothetical protein [Pyrinomonadaceae bacterium]
MRTILITEGIQGLVQSFRSLLLALTLLATLAATAAAQRGQSTVGDASNQSPRRGEIGSPEEEIIRRAEIKHEEESHKEMIERADEAALIGEQLLNTFQKNKSLSRDDFKKLERMEKLARKIRGSTGGSDDEAPLDNPPQQMDKALARLAEVSGQLDKSVQKTSRLVISAAVINSSNELIELIKHIRSIQRP